MRVCTLASGSSGNSVYIEGDGTSVLIDAGLSGKAITGALNAIGVDASELDAILVTHEHTDHIKGVGVMARKFDLKVFATENTWDEILSPIGKIPECNRLTLESNRALEIGGLQIEHFATSHDAVDSVGYCLYSEGVKIGVATDTGCLTNAARSNLERADVLVFEANHDLHMLKTGPYPWHLKQRILGNRGHLSNIAAGHCLSSLVAGNTKAVILSHLSRENNLPELAFSTVAEVLAQSGLSPGRDFALEVAPRSHPGTLWEIE
ncbi:MAG TPA: MBL fold metallo-hydrolase [Desulfobacteria bacterium]|nr:MBL fold metallo-hydrolase [Desulfobacteria bacterium]